MEYKDDRIKADFKTRLKEIMEIRGVRAADVRNALGIAKSTYSQYMTGRNEAKAERVHQLAQYFNCSEAWLMGYDVPMQRDGAQKKNDQLVGLIARLRRDESFAESVKMLDQLKPEQLASFKQLLSTFVEE